MGLLYKKQSELNYNVEIKLIEDRVRLSFSADCGKFGTNEQLDEYEFTKKELLEILQKDDANGAPDYRALYEQENTLHEAAERVINLVITEEIATLNPNIGKSDEYQHYQQLKQQYNGQDTGTAL